MVSTAMECLSCHALLCKSEGTTSASIVVVATTTTSATVVVL